MSALARPPDLREPVSDAELRYAIRYYADRASRVNPNGSARRQLRRLLRDHDLRVAEFVR